MNNKTYDFFHAKDDCSEGRREVFHLLHKHQELNFHAVVQSKYAILKEVRRKNIKNQDYHYSQNKVYDRFVKRLFRNDLHKEA